MNRQVMESYHKMGEVLVAVTKEYGQLRSTVATVQEQVHEEQVRMVLSSFEERIGRLENGLRWFIAEASKPLLDTWIQYVPPLRLHDAFMQTCEKELSDPECMVEGGSKAFEAIRDYFETVAEQIAQTEYFPSFRALSVQADEEGRALKREMVQTTRL